MGQCPVLQHLADHHQYPSGASNRPSPLKECCPSWEFLDKALLFKGGDFPENFIHQTLWRIFSLSQGLGSCLLDQQLAWVLCAGNLLDEAQVTDFGYTVLKHQPWWGHPGLCAKCFCPACIPWPLMCLVNMWGDDPHPISTNSATVDNPTAQTPNSHSLSNM